MIDWVNSNQVLVQALAALAQAVATLVLVLVTIWYAWETRRLSSRRADLRFWVRDFGFIGDRHKRLRFEVANGAGATALYPVVRLRALPLGRGRRFWYPSWLSEERARRWHFRVPLPQRRGTWIYDMEEAADLHIPAHSGARALRAVPRGPDTLDPFLLFLALEFKEEGRRRVHRVRATGAGGELVGIVRYWLRMWGFWLFDWIPKADESRTTLEAFNAKERARGA